MVRNLKIFVKLIGEQSEPTPPPILNKVSENCRTGTNIILTGNFWLDPSDRTGGQKVSV